MSEDGKLLRFVRALSAACAAETDEPALLAKVVPLLGDLVAADDWLDEAFAQPHPVYYQQHLLFADPLDRFSVVSFVWGPGQRTPVHDHTVWGAIGVLRGAETTQRFRAAAGTLAAEGAPYRLEAGSVECVSPRLGDVHSVANAHDDRVSISIHVYGGNIGRIERHVYDPATGARQPFVSGYSNAHAPNLWKAH